MNKSKKIILSFLLYFIAILLFTYFSKTVHFVDSHEYITSTKEFAGISNVNVFQTHSLTSQFIGAQILKLFPNMFTLKLITSIWLLFIGLLIYFYSKNEISLYLWMFSPIAWLVSIQVNPIVASAFFALLAYVLFKKYESSNLYAYFIISGLSAGIAILIYYSAFILIALFILCFMISKKFYIPLIYMGLIFIALVPELIINYIFFGNPLYSMIRYIGANYFVSANQFLQGQILHLYWLLVPIALTPLLYKIFKVDRKKYLQELIFLALCFLAFGIRGMDLKYLFIFVPILILLVSQKVSKKEFYISTIISLLVISGLTYGFFTSDFDQKIINDLDKIKKEYPSSQYISSGYQAAVLASYSWNNIPKFIWSYEYSFERDNKISTSNYEFKTTPKINSDKILVMNFRLDMAHKIRFTDPVYYISVQQEEVPKEFKLLKKYDILSIYEKGINP